jgi:hypothetical protein
MRSFILCAGQSNKIDQTYKQLLKIENESILDRTLRQVNGTERIIVGFESSLRRPKIKMVNPEANRCIVETLYTIRGAWSEKNIVLLGDVYYSDDGMKLIYDSLCFDGITFYYRRYGTKTSILAMSFGGKDANEMMAASETVIQRFVMTNERGGKLHDLYNAIKSDGYLPRFIVLDDKTSDFDTKAHVDAWREKYATDR